MKFTSKFLLILLLLVFFAGNSCRKDLSEENNSNQPGLNEVTDRDGKADDGKGATVLGRKLNNPYALNIIKQAYQDNYNASAATLLPTHLYVRFLPTTPQQLSLLDIENGEYWDFPLDYTIIHRGDSYHDPAISDLMYTWLYTVVPAGYQFPAVQHEILEEMVYVPDATKLLKRAYELTANTWDEPDVYLLTPPNFHDGVLEYPQPLDDDGGGGGGGGTNPIATECGCPNPNSMRKPSGCVTVFDTQRNTFEPVRHIQVITAKDDLGLLFLNRTETNDNGCFTISHEYHNKIQLWVKFKSSYCSIKTMKGVLDLDGYSFARKGYKGSFGGPNFNNLAIRLSSNTDVTNADHLNWKAATANNALHEYRDWCYGNGITSLPPENLKILMTPLADGSGATAMLDKMPLFTATFAALGANIITKLFRLGSLLPGLVEWLAVCAPDVILNNSNGADPSDALKEVAYHELGHTSHWQKSGSSYWQANILYVADVILTQNNNSPYGSGTLNGFQRCAVIEAWGFHVGETLSDQHYGLQSSDFILRGIEYTSSGTRSSYIQALEAHNPRRNSDPWRWIPIGIFNDLIDDAGEISPIKDLVNRGFTEAQLFNCLDVTSLADLKANVQVVPGNAQTVQVDSLFATYGY